MTAQVHPLLTAFVIAGGVLLFLTAVTLVISYIAYVVSYRRDPKRTDVTHQVLTGPDYDPYAEESLRLITEAEKIPFEEVHIRSYDGLDLFGRIYLNDPSKPFHVQFNGYRGNGIRDFAGGLQLALDIGHNILLVDQRSHGKSEGTVICFGVKERFDVRSWVAYVAERFGKDTPVYLDGISMGAATVLMASDLDFACPVKGIVADCPYSSPFGILRKVSHAWVKMGDLTVPFIVLSARLFGHFSVFGSSALTSVAQTHIPILLIHGTEDHFVPFSMSEDLYRLRPDVITFLPVEGAPHGLSCLKDRERYTAALRDFVARTEKKENN